MYVHFLTFIYVAWEVVAFQKFTPTYTHWHTNKYTHMHTHTHTHTKVLNPWLAELGHEPPKVHSQLPSSWKFIPNRYVPPTPEYIMLHYSSCYYPNRFRTPKGLWNSMSKYLVLWYHTYQSGYLAGISFTVDWQSCSKTGRDLGSVTCNLQEANFQISTIQTTHTTQTSANYLQTIYIIKSPTNQCYHLSCHLTYSLPTTWTPIT